MLARDAHAGETSHVERGGRGSLRRRVGFHSNAVDSDGEGEAEVLDDVEQEAVIRELFVQSRTLDHAWRIFCLVSIASCGILYAQRLSQTDAADSRSSRRVCCHRRLPAASLRGS